MCTRCRLLLLTAVVSFSPSATLADAVLLIGSGDSTNNALLQSVLTAQGDTVTVGPTFNNFTGGNLSGYSDVLLVPNGSYVPTSDMPVSGQQALVNYVNSGGGLVTSEWLMQDIVNGHQFQTLYPVLPFSPGFDIATSNTPITFSALTKDPVMNANLPNTFAFPAGNGMGNSTESLYFAKSGATAFFATNQWTSTFGGNGTGYGVVGWNYGQGRVLSISTALDDTSLTNLNFAQLVDNSVNWAAHGSILPPITLGPNPPHEPVGFDPVPEPAALITWGAGILGIIAVSYVRRTRAEP
jgi:hypothetical protein